MSDKTLVTLQLILQPAAQPDRRRRKLLVSAAGAALGLGAAAASVPFFVSMAPSERAKALGGPVEADVASVKPGQLVTVEWRGKPVWISHRTSVMLDRLGERDGELLDPRSEQPKQLPYCKNATRSIKPELFVAVGLCTHLGCIPTFAPELNGALGVDWDGGFYCSCHGSRFDLAGRVFRNVPAPKNLEIPPHAFASEARIVIGGEKRPAG